jgi:hypothetical protein
MAMPQINPAAPAATIYLTFDAEADLRDAYDARLVALEDAIESAEWNDEDAEAERLNAARDAYVAEWNARLLAAAKAITEHAGIAVEVEAIEAPRGSDTAWNHECRNDPALDSDEAWATFAGQIWQAAHDAAA